MDRSWPRLSEVFADAEEDRGVLQTDCREPNSCQVTLTCTYWVVCAFMFVYCTHICI